MPAKKPGPDPIATEKALKAAAARKLRRQMGSPLPLTDVNLDALSTVTDADAAVVSAQWDRDSGMPGLLEATPEELA